MKKTTMFDHVLFIAVTVIYWMSLYVYVPVLSLFLDERGLSMQMIGLVLGSYGFVQIVVRFPLGMLSDKIGRRKPFILIGMATGAASCLLFLLPGWLGPLAGRLMAGVCASTWVAFTVLYASYFTAADATRAMGRISFMTASGQLIGMTLSGVLADRFDWGAVFGAGFAAALIGLLLAAAIREPRERADRPAVSFAKLGSVVRKPLLVKVSLLSVIAHSILFITMFGFTPLKAEQLGAGGLELTYVVFAFMIPHAFTSLFSARWFAPRLGSWQTVMAGFALSALFTAAIAFSPSLGWLMATQALNGFAQGLHFPLLLGMSIQEVELPERATAMGFYQAVYSVGMFAGPFLAGWLNDSFGLTSGFWLGAVLGAAAAMLAARWSRPGSSGASAGMSAGS
mgnify:CR=1 FL=1